MMSKYSEWKEILNQHFTGSAYNELCEIVEKAEKYEILKEALKVYDYGFDGNTTFRCGIFTPEEAFKIIKWRKQLMKDFNIDEEKIRIMLEERDEQ